MVAVVAVVKVVNDQTITLNLVAEMIAVMTEEILDVVTIAEMIVVMIEVSVTYNDSVYFEFF